MDTSVEETYADVSVKYMYWDRSSLLTSYQIRRAMYYGDIGSATFMQKHSPFPINDVYIPSRSSIDAMKKDMISIDIIRIDQYDPIVIENMYEWWSIHDQRIINRMLYDTTISIDRRMALSYATRTPIPIDINT